MSETGLAIAAIRAAETERPDRLFADPLAAVFSAAGGRPPSRRRDGRAEVQLRFWVVARTAFLDDLLAEAFAAGIRQVVLLGAGFDARAFRLPWPAEARCFELDTEEVLDRKATILAGQDAVPRCELIPVACDLRGDWTDALLAAGLRTDQPVTWIAEGLLVYLDPAEVDQVITDLTSMSAPGSRLGLTLSGNAPGTVETVTRRRSGAPDDPEGWLAGLGWTADITTARAVLRAHGRAIPERRDQTAAAGTPPRRRGLLIKANLTAPQPSRDHNATSAASRAPANPAGADHATRVSPAREASQGGTSHSAPAPGPDQVADLDLSVLLSQALMGFTIEFDNEFEHQLPHHTTRGPASGSRRGPYLVSAVMWWNFMRLVTEDGTPAGELAAQAGLSAESVRAQLTRMERWWGYVTAGPDPADSRPKPPRRDWLVRPTTAGRRAQELWRPLTGIVEERWRARFGARQVSRLATALRSASEAIVQQAALPWFLPVGGIGSLAAGDRPGTHADDNAELPLPVLLSRALLAFTLEFERESPLPLAISANALRVISPEPAAVRDVQRLTGLAAEAVSGQIKRLEADGYLAAGTGPSGGRTKFAWLTPAGQRAQAAHSRLTGAIESRWRGQCGAQVIDGLRTALAALLGQPEDGPSRMAEGLTPYPDGWRAHPPYRAQTDAMLAAPSAALPHYPVISHRGGFPDGS